jgi:MFS family permease
MRALIVILSAQLMVVLDFSIVNVALPSLARDLALAVATAVASTHPAPGDGYRAALAVAGGLAAVAFGVSAAFVRSPRAGELPLARPVGQADLRRCAACTPS